MHIALKTQAADEPLPIQSKRYDHWARERTDVKRATKALGSSIISIEPLRIVDKQSTVLIQPWQMQQPSYARGAL